MEDVQTALKELFAETLQSMLEAEPGTELGYEKHDIKNKVTPNSRNGKTKKTVNSEYGEIKIQVRVCKIFCVNSQTKIYYTKRKVGLGG